MDSIKGKDGIGAWNHLKLKLAINLNFWFSMSDYARQLCNELMGLDRNKTVYEEKTQEKRFYDKDVNRCL